jgi:flagellar motor switch protein FliM
MNPGDEIPAPSDAGSQADVERLLASVAAQEAGDATTVATAQPQAQSPKKDSSQPYDFRNPTLLSLRELRKLRLHQDEFINALAARISLYLRMDFSLKLTGLQTIAYQKLVETWANPSHLALFKIEPLRGVSILEIPPRLGSSIVDRLMGGPGVAAEGVREMSEIEEALLEQIVQIAITEWCGRWSKLKELKPVLLGHESNGRFVQTASPETIMLVLSMEAGIGACTETVQLAFPYIALEPLIRKLGQGTAESAMETPVAFAAKAPPKWNSAFDEVCIPVAAEWQGLEMSGREVLALKVGDVLKLDPRNFEQVNVRLADAPKFTGRPGTVSGKWAVELTQLIRD